MKLQVEAIEAENYLTEDKEKVAAEQILNVLVEQNFSVSAATTILEFCKETLQFSIVSNYKII